MTDLVPALHVASMSKGVCGQGSCSTRRSWWPTRVLASFVGADVVIPLTVIEELDSLKTRVDDVGRAARTALRTIEELRVSAGGSLAEPPHGRRIVGHAR